MIMNSKYLDTYLDLYYFTFEFMLDQKNFWKKSYRIFNKKNFYQNF